MYLEILDEINTVEIMALVIFLKNILIHKWYFEK